MTFAHGGVSKEWQLLHVGAVQSEDWGTEKLSAGMGDGASARSMECRQSAAVTVDVGTAKGQISQLYSRSNQVFVASQVRSRFMVRTYPLRMRPQATEFLIRFLDIFGSLFILTLTLPVMVVASLLIRITAGRPVLFRQERVGLAGKVFTLYKFRTMINDAEKHVGPVWAARDDGRVTAVGRILRKMRIDELPQLYNILRGDMSLVGPRPERPFFVLRHQALQGMRLAVKPGLTGLAQIRGFYDLKPTHKVKYDCLYIQKRSFLLNVYILLRTIPALFTKMGW